MRHAVIDCSSSGSNTIVAAVPGRILRVLSYVVVANAAVVATWKSGSTSISGPMNLAAAGSGVSAPPSVSSMGYFAHLVTAPGEALVLSLGGAVQVGGHLTYEVV